MLGIGKKRLGRDKALDAEHKEYIERRRMGVAGNADLRQAGAVYSMTRACNCVCVSVAFREKTKSA